MTRNMLACIVTPVYRETLQILNPLKKRVRPSTIAVKLIDFGITVLDASARSNTGSTREATLMLSETHLHAQAGTAHYMPPEQWEGDAVDATADIFALGVTLFQTVTGLFPFANGMTAPTDILQDLGGSGELPDAREVAPQGVHVSDRAASTIAKAIAKDRRHRWQSAVDMQLLLQKSLLMANTDTFHVFLSYRVSTEAWFVELLYEALRKRRINGGRGPHTQVFWDKMCLQNGQPWEEGFMIGLTGSVVVVPILSLGSTEPLAKLPLAGDRVDNVLLEWMTSLALLNLHSTGVSAAAVRSIFPVFMGKLVDPLAAGETSSAPMIPAQHSGADQDQATARTMLRCSDFLTDGSDGGEASYPEEPTPSMATFAKMDQHLCNLDSKHGASQHSQRKKMARALARYGASLSGGEGEEDGPTGAVFTKGWLETQHITVSETVNRLKQMDAFEAHTSSGPELVESCANAIIKAIDQAISGPSTSIPRRLPSLRPGPEAANLSITLS
ncbi:hypothetical protein CYMTET_29987 [Cymbomonas tetramitiformis]|uniref:Protein kinase domain-containing protein n=1 Tax=Cymbomonas tetramitiformis TaxID=36881 RepID=A0AAE0KUM5_9CHLO|nr:hypothetical protein CYMTET_29987 [Cymbomonas tetramitiformis]